MKLFCCRKCPVYQGCERKWVRGEKGEPQLCCEVCPLYKCCLEGIARGKGLDIGTAFVKSAQGIEGNIEFKILRNAFFEIEYTDFSKKIVDNSNIKYIVKDGKLYIVGDEALEFANMFNKETRRPLSKGVVSPTEKEAIPMMELLMKSVIGKPSYEGETIYFSVPGEPVDADFNLLYHIKMMEGFLKALGYTPKPINEGQAVILSELAQEGFTGMGISFGGGMVNICLSFMSVPVFKFSVAKAGDWIDQQVAIAMHETVSRVSALKESALDLSKQEGLTKIERALSIYYNHLIEYVIENIKQEFNKEKIEPRLTKPISIVLSGGTSLPDGFIDRFRQILELLIFPVAVSEVRMAAQPLNSVAKGALIAAQTEESKV